MSVKPDFATMTTIALRAYVLEHRNDEEALYAYLDKLHAQKPQSRVFKPEEDVAEAIAEYMKSKGHKQI